MTSCEQKVEVLQSTQTSGDNKDNGIIFYAVKKTPDIPAVIYSSSKESNVKKSFNQIYNKRV